MNVKEGACGIRKTVSFGHLGGGRLHFLKKCGIGNVDGEVLEDANGEVQGDSGEVSEEAMESKEARRSEETEPAGS